MELKLADIEWQSFTAGRVVSSPIGKMLMDQSKAKVIDIEEGGEDVMIVLDREGTAHNISKDGVSNRWDWNLVMTFYEYRGQGYSEEVWVPFASDVDGKSYQFSESLSAAINHANELAKQGKIKLHD